MMDELNLRLEAIFREAIGPHVELRDDLTATATEGWDSLAHVNLIFAIEEDFRIRFGPEEMAEVANVGELKALIRSKLSSSGS